MKVKAVFLFAGVSLLLTFTAGYAQVPVAVKLSGGTDYYQKGAFRNLETSYSDTWSDAGYRTTVSNPLGFSPSAGLSLVLLDSSWLFPSVFIEGMSHLHSMGIADYSAEFRLTTQISGIYTGIGFAGNFLTPGLYVTWRTGLISVKAKSAETFDSKLSKLDGLGAKPESVEKVLFLFAAEPGLSYELPVVPGIAVSADLSWLVTTYSSFSPSFHQKDMTLYKAEKLTLNFTGFRARAGISVSLNRFF
ncbi:MAG: hypothetical protein L6Q77_08820 [Bacteroidetes bacterium]|nr:hypothetical protein [Bacteroidota bacterium]